MNTFYSATGQFKKIDIIENLDDEQPTNISLISYMIENEKMKDRVIKLEDELVKLEDKIKEYRKYLPYSNEKTSRIVSKTNNNWISLDDNIVLDVKFDVEYNFKPQVFVELIENNNLNVKYKTQVYGINKKGFKCKLTLDDFYLNNFKDNKGINIYSDKIDFIKKNVSLNYIIVGQ